MESSKYSYPGSNGYNSSHYLKTNNRGSHGSYGLSMGMTRSNRELGMQCEVPGEKGLAYSYSGEMRPNDSYRSEHGQNISTNFTSKSMLSQDFANSSFNTPRNSTASRLMEPERNKASVPNAKNQKPIVSIFNKASDFWAETLGFKAQETSVPSSHHNTQRKEVLYHQQEPAVVKKIKQVPSASSIQERYLSNQETANYESKLSESGYALQKETSSYTGDNQGALNDDQSSASGRLQGQNSQANSGRNNTLYKYLNQYFDANQPKLEKMSQALQKSTNQQLPQTQCNGPVDESSDLLPEKVNIKNSANDGGISEEVLVRSELTSQALSIKRMAQKTGSSLLRSKLEAHQKTLSSTTRVKHVDEKIKIKPSQKLRTIERDELIQYLINKREEDANKIANEAERLKTSSQIIREHHTSELNSSARKSRFSLQEDQTITFYFKKYGSDWKTIAKYLPGRTETMIRNRFYSTIKKKRPELLNADDNVSQHNNEAEGEDEINKQDPQEIIAQTDSAHQNLPNDSSNRSLGPKVLASENELEPNNTRNTVNNNSQIKDSDIEAESKAFHAKNDGFAEPDLFARDFFRDNSLRKNSCDMEFGCLSPIVNSCMPFEWEHSNLFVPEMKNFQGDPFDFSPKLDSKQKEGVKHGKDMPEENYLSYLIDFNQEPQVNRELDLDQNSICSTAEKHLQQRDAIVEEQRVTAPISMENERIKVTQQSTGNNLKQDLMSKLMLDETATSSNQIFTLVNQIKSIEMLFNLTRKEIKKLQSEFGSN